MGIFSPNLSRLGHPNLEASAHFFTLVGGTSSADSFFHKYSVTHGSEIPYVYGNVTQATKSDTLLSNNIMDYWISFVTSLDPNDGRGNQRKIHLFIHTAELF